VRVRLTNYDSTNGKWKLAFDRSGTSELYRGGVVSADHIVFDGQDTTVVIVSDGSEVRMYVDGKRVLIETVGALAGASGNMMDIYRESMYIGNGAAAGSP
jgi:hypothetical protein